VLAPAFYAGKDTRTPVGAGIVYVIITIAVSLITVGTLGLSGLALGTAVGVWAEAGILLILLSRLAPTLPVWALVRSSAGFAIGAVLAGVAAYATAGLVSGVLGRVDPSKVNLAIELLLAGAAGLAAYIGFSVLTRVPELPESLALVRAALGRGPGRP
jgi:putative peptidoglycan lipid II flippase